MHLYFFQVIIKFRRTRVQMPGLGKIFTKKVRKGNIEFKKIGQFLYLYTIGINLKAFLVLNLRGIRQYFHILRLQSHISQRKEMNICPQFTFFLRIEKTFPIFNQHDENIQTFFSFSWYYEINIQIVIFPCDKAIVPPPHILLQHASSC